MLEKFDKNNPDPLSLLLITCNNDWELMTASAEEILRNYIKDKGLRNTPQRDVILDAFLAANRHITAEELLEKVREKDPEISSATVYRNLRLMCECGLADEIKIGRQKTRFEQKFGHEHHDHLICKKCGSFIEVHDDKIEVMQDKLAEANNFVPLSHKLEIYGICSKCR